MRHGRFQGSMPSKMILLPSVIAVTVAVGACDMSTDGQPAETFTADQAQYAGICEDTRGTADEQDDVRVDDDKCGDDDDEGRASSGGFSFVWIDLGSSHNHAIPAHGSRVPSTLGSATHPRNAVVMKKLPASAFTKADIRSGAVKPASPIVRGGFGVGGSAGKGSSKGGTSSGS